MPSRTAVRLLTVWLLLGAHAASAGDCVVSGPPVRILEAETLDWTFVIASGKSCLRGLRSGAMLLDAVSLAAPAKAGTATVQGYGFSYQAPAGYKGEDEFTVFVAGTNRGVRGASTIHVHVSER